MFPTSDEDSSTPDLEKLATIPKRSVLSFRPLTRIHLLLTIVNSRNIPTEWLGFRPLTRIHLLLTCHAVIETSHEDLVSDL